ncbi:MAG: glycosyltransferase, partial [Candidatus Limnocylindrales bacterium]
MRIAQVNDIASVGATLADGLRRLGHEVDLLDAPRPGRRLSDPARTLALPLRLWALLALAPRIWAGHYDVVHAHYAWKGAAALPSGRPVVLHCHGSDVRGVRRDSLLGRWNAAILGRADRVDYATPDLAAWVLPIRSDARFMPNPIDVERFAPSEEERGEPSGEQRDLLVGVRLDPVKGLDAITTTVGRLLAIRPATSITIVDQGPGVGRIAAVAGRAARIVPPVSRAALPALDRAHLVALGQSAVGAIGNYELEALASGVPVAADFRFPEAYDEPPPLVRAATPEEAATGLARL